MFSVYNGYTKVQTNKKKYFFAGANTADGFIGTYSDIADERKLKRVYIIKGASGTGKSTLMKKIAESCEDAGFEAEYYLCGSDPFSIDCVVIDGQIAVLDGTAPHIRDMQYPGTASSYIDLSKFWDDGILEKNREEIIFCSTNKALEYASAYRYIKAADQLERERYICAVDLFNREKAEEFIERLLKKIKVKEKNSGDVRQRYTHALTMRGKWYIDLSEQPFSEIYTVTDTFGLGPLFMNLLEDKVTESGFTSTVFRMPLRGNITAVSLDNCGILITAAAESENETKKINLKRFLSENGAESSGGKIKLAGKCEKECLDDAENILRSASEYHFRLEEIYKSAMDFSHLGEYTVAVADDIISRLKK